MHDQARPRKKRPQEPSEIQRSLPASPDAEKGVLASCLLAPDAIGMCIERGVAEEWFHIPAHGTIYEVIVSTWSGGQPTDFISVTEELRKLKLLDACGGAEFITSLFMFLPTAANIGYYLDILEKKYLAREIILQGTRFASNAYDEAAEVIDLLDDFERGVMGIRKIRRQKRADVKTLTMEVIDDFQRAYENPGVIGGMTTGFSAYDDQCDGLHPEQMVVIAARPGMGKTAFAMGIAEHIAIGLKKPVAVFSLEMSSKQLVQRMICSMAKVNYFAFRDGRIKERDFPAITAAASKIADCKDRLIIDDASGQSIQEVRAKARRLKAEHGIVAVFIDYLQLLTSSTKRGQENRQQEVSDISTGCKQGARELGIPWVVLAQINRDVEKQGGRKPRLSDLRDSGSIEQDADVVAFLTRPELMTDDDAERESLKGQAYCTIAKQRNGSLGDIPLTFISEYARYENRTAHDDAQQELLEPAPKRQSPIPRRQRDNA